MKLFLDCYPCVLRQALTTARLSKLSDDAAREVLNCAMRLLLNDTASSSPQSIAAAVYHHIENEFLPAADHALDPYARLKKESTALVLKHFDTLERGVIESDSPLETAVKNAAAGNIIDFGALHYSAVDIEKEIEKIPALSFSIYDFPAFAGHLCNAKQILYIGDNAGEIVFDRILIRQIKRELPDVRITFATRGQPILNDVTVADARESGMESDAVVLSSGSPYPGTVLEETSPAFKKLFHQADMIIAKGQGNYEGLWEVRDERLFFILRVKCDRIADSIQTKTGALVLQQKSGDRAQSPS